MEESVKKLEKAVRNFIENAEKEKEKTNILLTICVSESGNAANNSLYGNGGDIFKALVFSMEQNETLKTLMTEAVFKAISTDELADLTIKKLTSKI